VRVKGNIHELLVVQVMRTSDVLQHRISKLMKEHDLTMPQYNILRILRGAKGDLSLGEMKERMLFDTSDVSRMLDRLVKKDLVHRNICPENRRKLDVCISDNGLELLKDLDRKLSERLNGFYKEVISEAEALEMTERLEQIAKN
jgi:DNA-binding MarR family transcriptional regulator